MPYNLQIITTLLVALAPGPVFAGPTSGAETALVDSLHLPSAPPIQCVFDITVVVPSQVPVLQNHCKEASQTRLGVC